MAIAAMLSILYAGLLRKIEVVTHYVANGGSYANVIRTEREQICGT